MKISSGVLIVVGFWLFTYVFMVAIHFMPLVWIYGRNGERAPKVVITIAQWYLYPHLMLAEHCAPYEQYLNWQGRLFGMN